MIDMSVIVCAHNPRRADLHRVLEALNGQTLPKDRWELLVVDNASQEVLADIYDLCWHARVRHVREDNLGLTAARSRGIREACGQLLVFVDDDNVLESGFLEEAWAIYDRYSYLGAFGAGSLEPEFEVQPPPELRARAHYLARRSVSSARWSNNPRDVESIPWGAGLCVSRPVANSYRKFLTGLGSDVTCVLGRRGKKLFCGDDDMFSWVAASLGYGFGIFPQLHVTHLIAPGRLNQRYFFRFLRDHSVSHGVLQYILTGRQPRRITWVKYVRLLLHGVKNGQFSLRCQLAHARGEDRAARYILAKRLQPGHFLEDRASLDRGMCQTTA